MSTDTPNHPATPTKATPVKLTMLDVLTARWKLEAEAAGLRMDLKEVKAQRDQAVRWVRLLRRRVNEAGRGLLSPAEDHRVAQLLHDIKHS